MPANEKGRPESHPNPNCVVYHDAADFKESLPPIQACARAERDFARKLARSVFGKNYATARDLIDSRRPKVVMAVRPHKGLRGIGAGIRSWRAGQ